MSWTCFRTVRFLCLVLAAGIVCLGLAPPAPAQNLALESPAGIAAVLDTDSAAIKKLAAARDFLTARQWSDAIELLRQVADQHKDKLVAVAPGRYIGVQSYCDILLASLPPEGLQIYRALVDPLAKQWFESGRATRDEELLTKVVRQAVVSSYGDDALQLLGEIAWEKGELSRARSYWQALLPPAESKNIGPSAVVFSYPDSKFDRSLISARLALCVIMQGNPQRSEREIRRFQQQYRDATGELAGKSGNLLSILHGVADEAERSRVPPGTPDVSTFAFNPERNKVLPQAVDVGTVQWSVPLEEIRISRGEQQGDGFEHPPRPFQTAVAGYYPVIYNDIVLVRDATSISAYNLRTGKPAWPGDDPKSAVIFALAPEQTQGSSLGKRVGVPRFTLTIDEGRLYASLGSVTRGHIGDQNRPAPSFLVCLDVAQGEGKLLWSLDSESVDQEKGSWTFEGSPLVAGGRVYVALRGNQAQPQSNVACFDAETGKLLWNRKVCVGMAPMAGEAFELRQHLLTLAEDRLYYNTNLGAIASLETQDGSVRWIATYPRVDIETAGAYNRRCKHGPNPCLFHEGTVVAAPIDSDRILAFDAETGIARWEQELPGQARALLGVGKGNLIVSGDQPWALDMETGRIAWPARGRGLLKLDTPLDAGFGRGLLVEDLIYWPMREEILILHQSTGAIRRRIALTAQHQQTGGNLAISRGFLLVAEPDRLVAFSEYGGLKKRYRQEISLHPRAALPHYRLALAEEMTGDAPAAIAEYRRARQFARAEEQFDDKPLRDIATERLGKLLLDAARTALQNQALSDAMRDFSEVADIAASPSVQKLAAVRGLGTSYEQAGDFPQALAMFQRLLDDAAWTRLQVDDETQRTRSAEAIGSDEIARLLRQQETQLSAPYERSAEQALAGPFQRKDAAAVREALRRFPHAAQVDAAYLRLAELQKSQNDSAGATRTLQALLTMPRTSPQVRQAALTGLARAAEKHRFWTTSATYWRQLATEYPESQWEDPAASATTVHDFVTKHLSESPYPQEAAAAGELRFPLTRMWDQAAKGGVIVPTGTPPSRQLAGVLVDAEHLTCLNPLDGTLRWRMQDIGRLEWAGYIADLLVLANFDSAAGVDLASGRVVWQIWLIPHGQGVARSLDNEGQSRSRVAASLETAARAHAANVFSFASDGTRLYVFRPGGELRAYAGDTGTLAWSYRPRAGTLLPHWCCGPGQVALQSRSPSRVIFLNKVTGAVEPAARTADELAVAGGNVFPWIDDPIALPSAGVLTVAGGQRIERWDPGESHPTWTYAGPTSAAHAPPDLLVNGSVVLLVMDGETLIRVDARTGGRLWRRSLGPDPVPHIRRQACLNERHAYIACGGVLRAFDVNTGALAWEQYLGKRETKWRVSLTGHHVIACSWGAAAPARVIVCDARQGDYVEKLQFDSHRLPALFATAANVAVIEVGTRVFGLRAK